MTVSTLTNRVTYIGNGSTTQFAVPFKVIDVTHLVVKRRVLSTNEIDYSYIGTDYSYSGIGDSVGTLTLGGTALSSAYQLEIERIVPYTQGLDIVNAGGFYPETVEDQLDLTSMQIQQIATQSNDIETRALMVPVGETAPSYETFAATFKGDPGGNAMAVGAFSILDTLTIPEGYDLIRTSERTVGSGWGGAFYVFDEDVDEAYVTANPETSSLDFAGRGFRLSLDQTIRPHMFGAVPYLPIVPYIGQETRPTTGITDAGTALIAFFAMLTSLTSTGVSFNTSGFYGTTDPLLMGPATAADAGYSAHPEITGHMTLITLAEVGGPVFTFRNMDGMVWNGALTLVAGDSTPTYATRHRWGIKVEGKATKQLLPKIEVYGFIYGITNVTNTGVSNFHEWNQIPMLIGFDCGSHYLSGVANTGLAASFTGVTTNGSDFTVGQTATLTGVTANLPTWIDDVGSVSEQNIALRYGTRIYRVVAFNRGANTVTVWPRLPTGTTTGSFVYFFGGVFVEGGADGSLWQIGTLSTIRAIGFNSAAIYPSTIGKHTSQADGTPFMWGRMSSDLSFGPQYGGGYVDGPYIEQEPGTFDGVLFGGGAYGGLRIGQTNMIDLAKVAIPAPWDGTVAGDIIGQGMKGMIYGNHVWEGRTKAYALSAGVQGDNFAIRADLDRQATYDPANVLTVFIEDYDAEQDKKFGVRSRTLKIIGTGANKQPTGTITLNATFFGNTINGGATATYSSLIRPLELTITAEVTDGVFTGNFKATEMNKPFAAGTAITSPTGGGTIDAEARTAIDSLRAALTAAGVTL